MNVIGARKAALALVTLHPRDQRWMLARLPRAWRSVLRPMIKDARRFASVEAEVLQVVLDDQNLAQGIEVPSPQILIAVLDSLSSQWAARALVAAAADHTELYLSVCSKQRAESIRHEMARFPRPFPPALGDALARCINDAGQVLSATEALR